jgi:exopolysaccharide biosynthesis polyprenyl glycosylphosphotransferase
MSTRESIASRERQLLRPAMSSIVQPWTVSARGVPWRLLYLLIPLAGDLAAIAGAYILAIRFLLQFHQLPIVPSNTVEDYWYYLPLFAIALYGFDGYASPELRRPEQEMESVCKALAVCFIALITFNFVTFRSEILSLYLVALWLMFACGLLIGLRFALRLLREALWRSGRCRRPTVLVGSVEKINRFQRLLSLQRHYGYEFKGAFLDAPSDEIAPATLGHTPVLGSVEQWEQFFGTTGATLLIIANPPHSTNELWLTNLLQRCKQLHVDVEFYSDVVAAADMKCERGSYSGCFRFYARRRWSLRLQQFLKRSLDVITGLFGSIVAMLLAPVVGIIIKLEDGGPVFYRSAYVRSDGQNGYYLKFRSMRIDADEILQRNAELRNEFEKQHKLACDPRVTRVGRFLRKYSIDEFPSFFSILQGDISLVGPRTITQAQRERYGDLLSKLLSVKPGLTGFWQVMGRQTTSYEEKVQLDMFYIDHWSIWLDLLILLKTFWAVIRAEGAY